MAVRLLLVTVIVATVGLLIVRATPYENPLAPYIGPDAAMLPGHPAPRQCDSNFVFYDRPDSEMRNCNQNVNNGKISRIWMTTRDGIIERVSVLPQTIQFGDMVALYGRPTLLRRHGRGYTACWSDGIRVIGLIEGALTLRSQLLFVDLGAEVC